MVSRGRARLRRWLPSLGAALLAELWLILGRRDRAAVVVGVAAAVAVATLLGVPLERWLTRAAVRVAAVLGGALALVAWVPLGVGGAVMRLARRDPFGRSPRGGAAPSPAAWRPRPSTGAAGCPSDPASLGAGPVGPSPVGRRVAAAAVGAFTLIGVVAVALPVVRWAHRQVVGEDQLGPDITFPGWAFPDAPWVAELEAAGWPVRFHPSLGWQNADVRTPDLNVVDGVRRSWTSPGGDAAARPVVWLIGGSTVYGIGQRDDHTIASEVSRRSAAAGRPVTVVNLGVPGYNQWQEIAVMGNRLSRGERPAVIVIYDGANDLQSMEHRATAGIRPLDEPPNRFHDAIEQGTNYRPEPRGEPASEDELRSTFVRTYGAGVDLARRVASAYDVPLVTAWQPTFASTPPSEHDHDLVRAMPFLAEDQLAPARARVAWIRAHLDPAVVDLGDAVDGATEPVFFDPVHTNEVGSRLVAHALWPHVAAALEASPRRVGDGP